MGKRKTQCSITTKLQQLLNYTITQKLKKQPLNQDFTSLICLKIKRTIKKNPYQQGIQLKKPERLNRKTLARSK